MLFASSNQDGKFKLVSPVSLTNLYSAGTQNKPSQIISAPWVSLKEDHFVETAVSVSCTQHFSCGKNDYILTGLEDGSLHLYDLTAKFGKSYTMPRSKDHSAKSLSSPYDVFQESNYEHADAVISINCSQVSPNNVRVLSASREGLLILWSVEYSSETSSVDDDILKFSADCDLQTTITKAKFLTESTILASTI